MKPWAALLAALLSAAGSAARAQLYPPAKADFVPRGLAVVDDDGRGAQLSDLLPGPSPLLLIPIFTRCAGTCPVLVQDVGRRLEKEGLTQSVRVVVFSFDAADGDEDLRSFRSRMELPKDWRLLRAARAGDALGFLDQFGFAVMRSGEGYAHPNELFVISPRGRWAATVAGGDIPDGALRRAASQAEAADRPRLLGAPGAAALAVAAALTLALTAAAAPILAARSRRCVSGSC